MKSTLALLPVVTGSRHGDWSSRNNFPGLAEETSWVRTCSVFGERMGPEKFPILTGTVQPAQITTAVAFC